MNRMTIVIVMMLVSIPAIAHDGDPWDSYRDGMDMLDRMRSDIHIESVRVADQYHRCVTPWPETGAMCRIEGDEFVCLPYLPKYYDPLGSCTTGKECEAAGDRDCKSTYGQGCGVVKGSGSVVELDDGTGSCSFKCSCNNAIGIRRCYKPTTTHREGRRGDRRSGGVR